MGLDSFDLGLEFSDEAVLALYFFPHGFMHFLGVRTQLAYRLPQQRVLLNALVVWHDAVTSVSDPFSVGFRLCKMYVLCELVGSLSDVVLLVSL